MLSNVTTKGQVTIPAEIRARFHIQANDRVDFFIDGERMIIPPSERSNNSKVPLLQLAQASLPRNGNVGGSRQKNTPATRRESRQGK
ncbi:AbrB/MazE/SpoVT family DNA-binding domain-containing protein [Oryzomonas sp.]|uniref:AbrB/MazE/SpoVT family DNA-binding domain-containing protein n=1 Tax=Oryzomonas sp. TaxID=2855186 RepID=UPI0038D45410